MAIGPVARRGFRVAGACAFGCTVALSVWLAARLAGPGEGSRAELVPMAGFFLLNGMVLVWQLLFHSFRPEDRGAGIAGVIVNWVAMGSADAIALAACRFFKDAEGGHLLSQQVAAGMVLVAAVLGVLAACAVSAVTDLVMLVWLVRSAGRERRRV